MQFLPSNPGTGWRTVRSLAVERVQGYLQQGIAPRQLAFALALGFVLGCIPVLGMPTALCAMLALVFRLNLPAIQAANCVATPLQVALIIPFVRLGGLLTSRVAPFAARGTVDLQMLTYSPLEIIRHSSGLLLAQVGLMAGQAVLAWLLLSAPVVLLLTAVLTGLLRRVPALAQAE